MVSENRGKHKMGNIKSISFIFILIFSFTSCCPREENIHPCTCEWPGNDGHYYVTCAGLDNVQDLEKAASFLSGKINLYSISVKDSAFMFIPSEAFRGLRFSELEITNSSLMALTDTDVAFVGLEDHLEIFTMSGCTLMSEWNWSILRNLKKLFRLHINDGDLENIEDLGKINMDNLKDVSFERNRIDFIHPTAFSNCKNLMILSLRDNEISEIARTMLPNPASEILDIDLGYNKIESFPDDMFSNMPKLQHLSIGNNKILVLSERVFLPIWAQLETFEALGNELRCDCRTTWILSKAAPQEIRATCFQPLELRGKNLSSLTSKNLWCYLANKIQRS